MEITQIDIISWMERIFFATISLVFVAVALKRRTVTWRWQKYQNSAQSLLLGDVTNNFSSNSAVNWPMFGKNYWLTKRLVFTTNFEPIVKQSVANNTLLSQILVKKPIYFYILDLYFRTGKNRVLDLYFRTEGVCNKLMLFWCRGPMPRQNYRRSTYPKRAFVMTAKSCCNIAAGECEVRAIPFYPGYSTSAGISETILGA